MSFKYNCVVNYTTNINQIYSLVKQHCIVHSPPWCLDSLLQPFLTHSEGRQVELVINYANRDVTLVSAPSVGRHVLQTAVQAFQNHRLATTHQDDMFQRALGLQQTWSHSVSTGQECAICFEDICQENVSTLPCAHSYHRHCIGRWLAINNQCPLCRTST
jgi:hypothetical protein